MSFSCSKFRSVNDLNYVQVIQIVLRSIVVVYNAVESTFVNELGLQSLGEIIQNIV